MAELVWTEPALADLEAIAEFIAFDDPEAANRLVSRVFNHVEQLRQHPKSGSIPKELQPHRTYRQIVEPPCRVFYRESRNAVFVLHVMRGEMLLRPRDLHRK